MMVMMMLVAKFVAMVVAESREVLKIQIPHNSSTMNERNERV